VPKSVAPPSTIDGRSPIRQCFRAETRNLPLHCSEAEGENAAYSSAKSV
jgi:hypothetical protein